MTRSKNTIYSSPSKIRFFHVYDNREEGQTIQTICDQYNDFPSSRTAERWLRDRRINGQAAAERRTSRVGHTTRGRPRKNISQIIDQMAKSSQKVREHDYTYFAAKVGVSTMTLKRRLHEEYIIRAVEASYLALSEKNKALRVEYGNTYKDKPLSFWKSIHFTDEVHFGDVLITKRRIFRKEGTRTDPENMTAIPRSGNITLHIAASISWHTKSEIIFYHDEHERDKVVIKDWKKKKPRHRKYETEEQ